jgi:PEGA domain
MSVRTFEPPNQRPFSFTEALASVAEALEKATPKATSCIDPLSLFPEETSSSLDRDLMSFSTADTQKIIVADRRDEGAAETVAPLEARILTPGANNQPPPGGMGQLEQRGADINTRLEETAAVAERQAIELAQRRLGAGHIGERLSALETRIVALGAPDQALGRGEADALALEQRAAAIVEQLGQITAQFELSSRTAEAQQRDISARLVEVGRIDERLSTFEARLGKLTAPDQPLAIAEARARQLEERGAETSAQLERHAAIAERQAQEISARFVKLGEIGEQLSVLETGIRATLDQPLAAAAVSVQQLEQRSADIVAQFQRSAAVSEAQWADIAQRIAQAAYAGEQLAGLDGRIGKLIGRGQLLERANGMVEQLELRMRQTISELERAIQTQDNRQREIARLHEQLEPPDTSTGRRIARGASSPRDKEVTFGIVAGITAVVLTAVLAPRSPHVATTERSRVSNQTSVSTPFTAALPASPAAAIDATQVLPAGLPGHLNNPSERPIATEKKQLVERVRTKNASVTARQSSAASVAKAPISAPVFVGALDIESDPPGSSVFIDRKYVGQTPIQLSELRAGSHVVWIVRDGHQRWTASVLVRAETRTHITATLQSKPAG